MARKTSILCVHGFLILFSCNGDKEDTGTDSDIAPPGFVYGEAIVCEAPHITGLGRFEDQAESRGIELPYNPSGYATGPVSAGVLVNDFDDDGDMDLALGRMVDGNRSLHFFKNDGAGGFTKVGDDLLEFEEEDRMRLHFSAGAVDMIGDPLSDLIYVYEGGVGIAENLGDFRFGPVVEIFFDPARPDLGINQVTWGDVDQDGDLDLFIPTFAVSVNAEAETFPRHIADLDILMENTGAGFVEFYTLPENSEPTNANLAMFTDRDGDGDADLLVPTDYANFTLPTAFYRNDGAASGSQMPLLVDDAASIGADLQLYGMGIDSADINRDGHLDYCFSSFGPAVCIEYDGVGGYIDTKSKYALNPPSNVSNPSTWSLWSLDIADLDNDGHLDIISAAGSPWSDIDLGFQPNNVWRGRGDGIFIEKGQDLNFSPDGTTYGLGTADLDGDGYLEFVFNGSDHPPEYWQNQCGEESWLEVDLLGPAPNREAFGARIEILNDGLHYIRELNSMRIISQGPSLAHFGFGRSKRIDELRIRWPDGRITEAFNVPVNRRIVALHPEIQEANSMALSWLATP